MQPAIVRETTAIIAEARALIGEEVVVVENFAVIILEPAVRQEDVIVITAVIVEVEAVYLTNLTIGIVLQHVMPMFGENGLAAMLTAAAGSKRGQISADLPNPNLVTPSHVVI